MTDNTPLYDELWDYGKPEETAVKFRTLLPKVKVNDDLSAYLQLLTQLARTQGLQSNFEEAHRILDEVEPQLGENLTIATIRYLLERGRAFNSGRKQDLARPLFIQAYELSQQIGHDFYLIDAAHMIAMVSESAEEEMTWNLLAMDTATKTSNKRARRWIGSLSNNIGWTYHDQEKYTEALDMFKQTQAFFLHDYPNPSRERIARWCIGKMVRLLTRYEDALAIQRQLHEEYLHLKQDDGYVQEEIGECLLAMNNANDATTYFAEAFRILSQDKWLQANEAARLARLQQLGR